MGIIKDSKKEREKSRKRRRTNEPLGHFGNMEQETNKFDLDEKTIRDQKNKE